jgi:hypothetical protein
MKSTLITSGKFANGEGQRGNFTGYNAKGNRIFIHKAQMENLGWTKDSDVKPFYALIEERDIQTRDVNGELTDVVVQRLQATSVFKTQDELLKAENSDFELSIASANYKKSISSSAGLNESQVNALLASAI